MSKVSIEELRARGYTERDIQAIRIIDNDLEIVKQETASQIFKELEDFIRARIEKGYEIIPLNLERQAELRSNIKTLEVLLEDIKEFKKKYGVEE
jgi:translation initiation factor 2 gamma subunit (eIF-2gamma)